jgi:hypothetical protein
MRPIGVLFWGLLALTVVQGCRHKAPEPIPGPKAGTPMAVRFRPAGIAWFQGSLEEAFAPAAREGAGLPAYGRADVPADVRTDARADARPEARKIPARNQRPGPTVVQVCPTRRHLHG